MIVESVGCWSKRSRVLGPTNVNWLLYTMTLNIGVYPWDRFRTAIAEILYVGYGQIYEGKVARNEDTMASFDIIPPGSSAIWIGKERHEWGDSVLRRP